MKATRSSSFLTAAICTAALVSPLYAGPGHGHGQGGNHSFSNGPVIAPVQAPVFIPTTVAKTPAIVPTTPTTSSIAPAMLAPVDDRPIIPLKPVSDTPKLASNYGGQFIQPHRPKPSFTVPPSWAVNAGIKPPAVAPIPKIVPSSPAVAPVKVLPSFNPPTLQIFKTGLSGMFDSGQ